MSIIEARIVSEFWEICNAAYESWLVHRVLFDNNADLERLSRTHCAQTLAHLSIVTQRDVLQQIAKLHDPARQFGQNNLSIGFVIESAPWDQSTRMRLHALKTKLDTFAEKLREARNKLTAHNGFQAIMAGLPLGKFQVGADIQYFKDLQELVDLVAGSPQPFNSTVRNDAQAFVESLVRGARL